MKIAAFAIPLGLLLALSTSLIIPVRAASQPVNDPTMTATPAPMAITPTATRQPAVATATVIATATAIPIHPAEGGRLGWPGQVQCFNCVPVQKHIQVHHYDPNQGDFNCFTYDEELHWCVSPTSSGINWQAVYGIAAACPVDWGMGPWIEIPTVGTFICLDHGDMIFCEKDESRCYIDILGPGGADWDGKEFDATLWVPVRPRKDQ